MEVFVFFNEAVALYLKNVSLSITNGPLFEQFLYSKFCNMNLGPISGPEEAEFILKRSRGVHGFYGASSMERLPVEQAITSTVKQYKSISI